MARKGNRNRRNSQSKTFKPKSAVPPPPPSPPPSAPRQAVRRTGVPPNSARSRAQRWDQANQQQQQTGRRGVWDDIFAPTQAQRTERDEELASRPDVVHMDPMEWWALEMARQGNDVALLDYQPTPSINPPRPRTLAAGYSDSTLTLRVRFRNGQVYAYNKVPPNVWRQFKMQKSPGRYINRVLNFYPYGEEADLNQPTGMS